MVVAVAFPSVEFPREAGIVPLAAPVPAVLFDAGAAAGAAGAAGSAAGVVSGRALVFLAGALGALASRALAYG